MSIITKQQLDQLAPDGKPNIIAAIANQSDRVFVKWMLEISVAQFVSYKGMLASCDAWDSGTVWHQVGGGYINIANHQASLDRTKAVITALGAADT